MPSHHIALNTPIPVSRVRDLHIGNAVSISGVVFTARDRFHQYAACGGACRVDLRHAVLYHCGPVIVDRNGRRECIAAGPTTSAREEPYMHTLMARFGLRMILGKGGMGPETLKACSRYGCVYVQVTGGAAQYLRQRIESVDEVHFLDKFGPAEALWKLRVRDFPGIVTMDTHGCNLYTDVERGARQRLRKLTRPTAVPGKQSIQASGNHRQ